jgi:glutamate synthase (NADPH) large chain
LLRIFVYTAFKSAFFVQPMPHGLYHPSFEHGSCGFGLICHIDGKPSHTLVQTAIESLSRLMHRGAVSADGKSGDGCGILMKKPERFLRQVAADAGFELATQYATGLIFLNPTTVDAQRAALTQALAIQNLTQVHFREVPVDITILGEGAAAQAPHIEQVFVNSLDGQAELNFNRALFAARKPCEEQFHDDAHFYVVSLSSRMIAYKGLVRPADLPRFYLDLQSEVLASDLCIFHQRFSTNTLPKWRLAQPFRIIAHNGEINTIRANRNWANARAASMVSKDFDLRVHAPLVSHDDSDSASLDNMLEALLHGGMPLFLAARVLVPPAWKNKEHIDPDLRALYDFYAMHQEPWDGPAGLVMTDGRYAVCTLDRNGLRPARYTITKDRILTLASEVGVWACDPKDIIAKGRVRAGEIFAVDTADGKLLFSEDIDATLATAHPYRAWLKQQVKRSTTKLHQGPIVESPLDEDLLKTYQTRFLLNTEEVDTVLAPLAKLHSEPIGSMGDDTPVAVLSRKPRSLYDYFRQLFAQVTNPPIDPIREAVVMSQQTYLGRECSILEATEKMAARMVLNSPILSEPKYNEILTIDDKAYTHQVLSLHYDPLKTDLPGAIQSLCDTALSAVQKGVCILILSDKNLTEDKHTVHALLATSAIHHVLVAKGLRTEANIIVQTATVWDTHHIACLIGFGATAVCPYLAYEALQRLAAKDPAFVEDMGYYGKNYRKGIIKGLYKIFSKMGISTVASYRGAGLFEVLGLHQEVVDLCFPGMITRIGGATFEDLHASDAHLHAKAFGPHAAKLQPSGRYKYTFDGEYHAYNPSVIYALQAAVTSGRHEDYQQYADLVNQRPITHLRDLLGFTKQPSIDIKQVESLADITQRFDSAAMSLGALSPEAHETLAMAMNQLGGRSNSGEGGEDPARFGTNKQSKIKQVASGRFGVTPEYLVNCDVIQIKIAQGAKPGEGGQLPGHKVNSLIARLRYAKKGVALISPPPHHDIYSIEDLAQLIFDLKQINPTAHISVKLVSEPGVGTIAAGVAKCYADMITISGYDGGTGASPLTSVMYAGSPWELGLAETQQVLSMNNLRSKVRLQTDGGLKTGVDVVKAAILGAESFGFGTGPMVAMGCKYLRICHLNNCATGVATQDKHLRAAHFKGDVDKVVNYFTFVAQEVRELLAELGVKSLQALIGRVELLEALPGKTPAQQHLDLSPLLSGGTGAQTCDSEHNEPYDKATLAAEIWKQTQAAVEKKSGGEFSFDICNTDRSVGVGLSGEIARRYGNLGMSDHPITLNFTGTAGQSFGAFNTGGVNLDLSGDANDYVGKGMAGGTIVITPPTGSNFPAQYTPIVGNTCLYGATGGTLFAEGTAGERFAVRNSGATAVVEGAGDHCCEYMTGGVVVVLGSTGINFGAGMTGGVAFVLDKNRYFVDCYNHELIDIRRIAPEAMEFYQHYLKTILVAYVEATGSQYASEILDDFEQHVADFWLVKPIAEHLTRLMEALYEPE